MRLGTKRRILRLVEWTVAVSKLATALLELHKHL